MYGDEDMSDVEESKVSCRQDFAAVRHDGQDFAAVPQSWASWITVDDGRTVEQVRMDQNRLRPSTSQTAARLNSCIENPALLQQMNLFMQIDEVNDEQQDEDMRIPSSPASSLPKRVIKKRRNNNFCQVPPARPLTRKNPRQRLIPDAHMAESTGTCQNVNNSPNAPTETLNGLARVSSRSRGSDKGDPSQLSANTLVAGSRRERHSIGDKLKKAFGVRPAAEPLRLGEKTAKLLHAVDCMKKSNIKPTN